MPAELISVLGQEPNLFEASPLVSGYKYGTTKESLKSSIIAFYFLLY